MWCELILKGHQNEEVIWMENFLSAETTAKHAWSLYHAGKKCVPTPTSSNSSIFPLLKDLLNMHGARIIPEKNMCQPLQPRIVPFFHY